MFLFVYLYLIYMRMLWTDFWWNFKMERM